MDTLPQEQISRRPHSTSRLIARGLMALAVLAQPACSGDDDGDRADDRPDRVQEEDPSLIVDSPPEDICADAELLDPILDPPAETPEQPPVEFEGFAAMMCQTFDTVYQTATSRYQSGEGIENAGEGKELFGRTDVYAFWYEDPGHFVMVTVGLNDDGSPNLDAPKDIVVTPMAEMQANDAESIQNSWALYWDDETGEMSFVVQRDGVFDRWDSAVGSLSAPAGPLGTALAWREAASGVKAAVAA